MALPSQKMGGGGVLKYTQDGSLGTRDGEPVQATRQSREFTDYSSRERERERDERWRGSSGGSTSIEQVRLGGSMVVGHDSGGELRVLDKQLLTEQAADTHTHTHTHGAAMLQWWMWMHREGQRNEPNPISRGSSS